MRLVLSSTSTAPIYEQIKDQLVAAIVSGELVEGDALPSLRVLARDLRVSVITTTRAYNELADAGFIVNKPGKGSFVLPRNPELMRERALADVEQGLLTAIAAAKLGGLTEADVADMIAPLWRLAEEDIA